MQVNLAAHPEHAAKRRSLGDVDAIDLVIGEEMGMRLNQDHGNVKNGQQQPAQKAMFFENVANGVEQPGAEAFDGAEKAQQARAG